MFYAALMAFVVAVLVVSFLTARRWKREEDDREQETLERAFRRSRKTWPTGS